MEFLREVAHLRPRTNLFGAVTRVRHTMMTAIHRHLTEQGFFWINTPIITTSDAEGAGDMFRLSTLDLANLPRTAERQDRLPQGFLRPRSVSHRVRPAQCRGLLPGDEQGLHLRPDLPRRELQHAAPPGRVLDGRAGNRVRRPAPTMPTAPRASSRPSSRPCWTSARMTWRSSPSACSLMRSAAWRRSSPSRSNASTTPTPSRS